MYCNMYLLLKYLIKHLCLLWLCRLLCNNAIRVTMPFLRTKCDVYVFSIQIRFHLIEAKVFELFNSLRPYASTFKIVWASIYLVATVRFK